MLSHEPPPQQHLPDELEGRRFYEPTDEGFEAEIGRRMKAWEKLLEGKRRRSG